MWTFIHRLASPKSAYRWASILQPWFMSICLVLFIYGLYTGLWVAPSDYQQGDAYRIMFIHVPAAIASLTLYAVMTIAALSYLVWKIKLGDMLATVIAPIGAILTALCLITGAIWGKPMWGTWWIWDARLTSELLLLFLYLGIIALRTALPNPTVSSKASSVLILVGALNLPVIHYSVVWWHTLHQGASLSFTGASIAASMLHPLLSMIGAIYAFSAWMACLLLRAELLSREAASTWVRDLLQEKQ